MNESKILTFKPTPAFGKLKRYFCKESIKHPAKINMNLCEWIIDRYTSEGDTVLDPMAGTGSTCITAAMLGRNAVGVEYEQKFHEWSAGVDCDGYTCHVLGCYLRRDLEQNQKTLEKELVAKNEEKINERILEIEEQYFVPDTSRPGEQCIDRLSIPSELYKEYIILSELDNKFQELRSTNEKLQRLPKKPHHFVGSLETFKKQFTFPHGELAVVKGDSRQLSKILKEQADKIIFSPPYSESLSDKRKGYTKIKQLEYTRQYKASKDNIGSLPHGNIDIVISSPPHSDTIKGGEGPHAVEMLRAAKEHFGYWPIENEKLRKFSNEWQRKWNGYSKDKQNIGNLQHGKMDSIIFSPPFRKNPKGAGITRRIEQDKPSEKDLATHGKRKNKVWLPRPVSDDPENIENLEYGEIDAIVCSVPYSEGIGHGHAGEKADKETHPERYEMQERYASAFEGKNNIGKLKHGKIDAVVTSPPHESGPFDHAGGHGGKHAGGIAQRDTKLKPIEVNDDNIINKSGESYLEAMLQVYRESYKVLKPGGIMVLVTKNFIRNKKIVRLDLDTIRLCEAAGFKLIDRWYRKLTSFSFWVRNYFNKYRIRVDYEDILVFKKLKVIFMKKQKRNRETIGLKISKRKKRIKTNKLPKLKPGQKVLIPFEAQVEFEPGWKEIIPTAGPKRFFRLLNKLMEKHGATTYGSYNFSIRINGGYANNHERGATMTGAFTGPLNEIYRTLQCNGIENKVKLKKIKFDN